MLFLHPSPIRMNISRINSLGNKNKDYNYLLLGRIPKREYMSPVKMNISRIHFPGDVKEDTRHRLG